MKVRLVTKEIYEANFSGMQFYLQNSSMELVPGLNWFQTTSAGLYEQF